MLAELLWLREKEPHDNEIPEKTEKISTIGFIDKTYTYLDQKHKHEFPKKAKEHFYGLVHKQNLYIDQ